MSPDRAVVVVLCFAILHRGLLWQQLRPRESCAKCVKRDWVTSQANSCWHAFVHQQSRTHSAGLDDPVSYIKAELLDRFMK